MNEPLQPALFFDDGARTVARSMKHAPKTRCRPRHPRRNAAVFDPALVRELIAPAEDRFPAGATLSMVTMHAIASSGVATTPIRFLSPDLTDRELLLTVRRYDAGTHYLLKLGKQRSPACRSDASF